MSWNFALHKINESFDQIAEWYRVFMHRTEQSFRALHERLTFLENQQSLQGPSDEQVERVLRKILAEKFADSGVHRLERPSNIKESTCSFQKTEEDSPFPNPIQIDTTMLHVDPDGVPSEAYRKQFKMLESSLSEFPHVDLKRSQQSEEPQDVKDPSLQAKARNQSPGNQHRTKPW
ncbi:uncharacterized protein BDR25DRAFT_210112 [Lindgomyces ingoldianus]|uniref:Uncharacterized protein n=1 Tax=Lindgomyces ingoldianus TaxID=673940 RepID=A0ACB6RDL4_9PLEO|nr:uncharacterized protein BDR25DRAFT_210112 [Lindgomyces ingoldianus]KAF2476607.1 hypothetical protein BDR25DRAFT_210112 [Lindgomyces ingoldianus]